MTTTRYSYYLAAVFGTALAAGIAIGAKGNSDWLAWLTSMLAGVTLVVVLYKGGVALIENDTKKILRRD